MSAKLTEASFRDVARALGMSPKTARRLEAEALAKLRAGLADAAAEAPGEMTPFERAVLRCVADSYCDRLMRCRPGELPDADPPRSW